MAKRRPTKFAQRLAEEPPFIEAPPLVKTNVIGRPSTAIVGAVSDTLTPVTQTVARGARSLAPSGSPFDLIKRGAKRLGSELSTPAGRDRFSFATGRLAQAIAGDTPAGRAGAVSADMSVRAATGRVQKQISANIAAGKPDVYEGIDPRSLALADPEVGRTLAQTLAGERSLRKTNVREDELQTPRKELIEAQIGNLTSLGQQAASLSGYYDTLSSETKQKAPMIFHPISGYMINPETGERGDMIVDVKKIREDLLQIELDAQKDLKSTVPETPAQKELRRMQKDKADLDRYTKTATNIVGQLSKSFTLLGGGTHVPTKSDPNKFEYIATIADLGNAGWGSINELADQWTQDILSGAEDNAYIDALIEDGFDFSKFDPANLPSTKKGLITDRIPTPNEPDATDKEFEDDFKRTRINPKIG